MIIEQSHKQMKTRDISIGYHLTVHSLFVAKPALGAMTPLGSVFQVMIKESMQSGDLLRFQYLSL